MSENGRSMVEMLGVLAIIGVLSVGAMNGYSKAMFKYRLNKFSESMNWFINNVLINSRSMAKSSVSGEWVSLAENFYKLDLLPTGITYNWSVYLRDIFGNPVWIFAYTTYYGIGYRFGNKGNVLDICQNLLNIYKENRHELHHVSTDQFASEDGTDGELSTSDSIYGDQYCTNNRKCLKNLTLDDIYTLCSNCSQNADTCRFYAIWY